MSDEPAEILKELLAHVKDNNRKTLVQAYLEKPDAESIVNAALDRLSKAINENHAA
jgi:hypothetical protein